MNEKSPAPRPQGCCSPLGDGASPYRSPTDAKAKYAVYLEALYSPAGLSAAVSAKTRIPGPRFLMDMFREARLEPTSSVAEVGATLGRSAILARRFAPDGKVVFVQLDPALAEMSQAEVARWGAHVEHLSGTPARLPLQGAAFDAVLVDRSFGFVASKTALLREIRRVLKPGGRLVIVDFVRSRAFPARLGLERLADRYACSLRSETEHELRRLLKDAGLCRPRFIRYETPLDQIPSIPQGQSVEARKVRRALRAAGVQSGIIIARRPQGVVRAPFRGDGGRAPAPTNPANPSPPAVP